MALVRSKFEVSTLGCFKIIAFFISVHDFVKYAGKNIRTSEAKRCENPNKEKKECQNCHNLFLGAETAGPEASKFESFFP